MSKPQATVLALWRVGMVPARSCALTAVATFVAVGRQRREPTVRPQRRECCDDAEAKRGDQRQALGVECGGVPLRAWGLRRWQGTPLALALEATTLGTRVTVLAIRVVSRGGAMPVAWTILPAHQPHAWRRAWRRRRRQLRPAGPQGWTVIGLADRGLSAGWLLRRSARVGWPPVWCLNRGGTCRPDPQAPYRPWTSVVPPPGPRWRGTGTAGNSRQRQRRGTLLAGWEEGDSAPWVSLTDVPPAGSDAGWDGLRAWLAQGFKRITRAGWPWPRARRTEPRRAARWWLAVAVATVGLLRVGGAPRTPSLRGRAAISRRRWRASAGSIAPPACAWSGSFAAAGL